MNTFQSDLVYLSAMKVSLDQKKNTHRTISCPICTKKKPYLVHVCSNSLSHQMCITCVETWQDCKHDHTKFQCPFCRRLYENTDHMTITGCPGSIYSHTEPKNQYTCIIPKCPKHCGDNQTVKCEPTMGRNRRYNTCKASICNPLHRLSCPFRIYSKCRGCVVIWSSR